MKIYLLDKNPLVTTAWQQYFNNVKNINIVTGDFQDFMKKHKVDCIVSPGNSKGIMMGGYDLAITDYFGLDLTKNVQAYIRKKYKGCQPVGTAFIIDIPKTKMQLIHCPTMKEPSVIKDPKVVKDCMIAVLQEANKNKIDSVVIPAFGGFTGRVNPYDLAKLMFEGYKQLQEVKSKKEA